MAQNVYDDESFFEGYSKLPRSVEGLDGAPEWQVLRSMLPPLNGRKILDLGCGFGWFCRWAMSEQASRVVGIDLSERMLDRARQGTARGMIEYRQADLDGVVLPPGLFDLVYSSLTLHYVIDLDRLLREIATTLVPGGSFVFSVEHPIFVAPSNPGFVTDGDGRAVWPLDRYLQEGQRVTNWLAPGVVKYHRTIEAYLRAIRRSGLVLSDLVEWGPSAEQIQRVPAWATERDRPPFLLISATRP